MTENIPEDPTVIERQTALTNKTVKTWLIAGGVVALLAFIGLIAVSTRQPGVTIAGVLALVFLYVLLVVLMVNIRSTPKRSGFAIAACVLMAAVAIVGVTIALTV